MPKPTPHSKSYRKRVALISTGGTIEKTYDEMEGVLRNEVSNLDVMLAGLELEGVVLTRVPLMNKDSLEMEPEDHALIAQTAGVMAEQHDGVVRALELMFEDLDRPDVLGHRLQRVLRRVH